MYLIFVSSLNENVKIANTIQKQLQEESIESKIINLVELELPLYDTDKEQNMGVPKTVETLLPQMDEAKGYIFVTPEYNFSIPPVLTNFIAWVTRSNEDFRRYFSSKYIQLASHSGSECHDVSACMRTQFSKLGSIVMPREITATYQHPLKEDSCKKILEQFISLSKG